MEICKAPTLRLKALNKHTHIMYIEMENVLKKKRREKTKEGYREGRRREKNESLCDAAAVIINIFSPQVTIIINTIIYIYGERESCLLYTSDAATKTLV